MPTDGPHTQYGYLIFLGGLMALVSSLIMWQTITKPMIPSPIFIILTNQSPTVCRSSISFSFRSEKPACVPMTTHGRATHTQYGY